jgi:hypothetical protein
MLGGCWQRSEGALAPRVGAPHLAAAFALVLTVLAGSGSSDAQPVPGAGIAPSYLGSEAALVIPDTPWEFSLDGRIGLPRGYVKVGENEVHGTHLRLHEDLGIDVSGVLEASVAFHMTPRDAIRASYLYYFLDGGAGFSQPIAFNAETFGPGHVDTNTDFFRVSLDYERQLLKRDEVTLTGTVGLTYVYLDVTLTGQGRRSPEDFYRQELPVPILGLRADFPLGDRFGVRAFGAGGGIPPVDSLRKEGGTIYLSQAHADGGVSVTYRITRALEAEAGYRLTYFFQHEKSHEDSNTFQLIDNGFQVGLRFRF